MDNAVVRLDGPDGHGEIKNMKTTESNWMRIIARDRLNLERQAAEDRRNESVARLAIELGRAKVGRPKKGCGVEIVPDVDAAARLLTDAAAARARERERPERERDEYVSSLWQKVENRLSPPLRWHEAKYGTGKGSGGVLSCSALCDAPGSARRDICVGRFVVEEFSDGSERSKWEQIGKWEVVRDENRFRGLVKGALNVISSDETRRDSRAKMRIVTDADVSKIVEMGEMSEVFFCALVQTRREAAKPISKGAAGGEAKPPRGKKAKA